MRVVAVFGLGRLVLGQRAACRAAPDRRRGSLQGSRRRTRLAGGRRGSAVAEQVGDRAVGPRLRCREQVPGSLGGGPRVGRLGGPRRPLATLGDHVEAESERGSARPARAGGRGRTRRRARSGWRSTGSWTVWIRPPMRSRASSTSTWRPAAASRSAAARPAIPAPTTRTSAVARAARLLVPQGDDRVEPARPGARARCRRRARPAR